MWLTQLWSKEPAVITALVTALISLLIAFGVPISDRQQGAIVAVIIAIGGLIVRHQVTPTSRVSTPTPPEFP